MPSLYLSSAGAHVRREGNQLVARRASEELARIPLELLDLVILQGPVQLSSGCIEACMARGIPIAYLSQSGRFLGRLEPVSPTVGELQRAQLRYGEDAARTLALARTFVRAKIGNSRVALEQWFGPEEAETREALEHARLALDSAGDLEVLRGYEGSAAGAYFRAISRHLAMPWGFERREAHPPVGAMNSLLSFGYTLLFNLVLGAIRSAGMVPHVGYFHADREGHATLASDLMEEWRAPVVDRLVMEVIRRGLVTPDDFAVGEGGWRLQPEARHAFLREWERKLNQGVSLPSADRRFPYRAALYQQVLHFARHVRHPDDVPYVPFRVQ